MLSFNPGGTEGYEESAAEQPKAEPEFPWKWDTASVELPDSSATQTQIGVGGLDDTLAFATTDPFAFNNNHDNGYNSESGQHSPLYMIDDDWAALG